MIKFSYVDNTRDEYARTVEYVIPQVDVTLDQMLEDFTYFLRGIGYVLPYDGALEFVKDEPSQTDSGCGKGCGKCQTKD